MKYTIYQLGDLCFSSYFELHTTGIDVEFLNIYVIRSVDSFFCFLFFFSKSRNSYHQSPETQDLTKTQPYFILFLWFDLQLFLFFIWSLFWTLIKWGPELSSLYKYLSIVPMQWFKSSYKLFFFTYSILWICSLISPKPANSCCFIKCLDILITGRVNPFILVWFLKIYWSSSLVHSFRWLLVSFFF